MWLTRCLGCRKQLWGACSGPNHSRCCSQARAGQLEVELPRARTYGPTPHTPAQRTQHTPYTHTQNSRATGYIGERSARYPGKYKRASREPQGQGHPNENDTNDDVRWYMLLHRRVVYSSSSKVRPHHHKRARVRRYCASRRGGLVPAALARRRDGGGAGSGAGSGGRVSSGKAATSEAGSCASHMETYPLAGWERVRWRVARRHSCCMVSW